MILDAVEQIRALRKKPWLILGKGPSLDLRVHFDLDAYNTFSINHACKIHAGTVAHFMDVEALLDCRDDLFNTDSVALPYVPNVVLPWVPHANMGPGHYNLDELMPQHQYGVLRCFAARGQLWSYNSTRVPQSRYCPCLSEVRVRYFSAVAAFNLLALAGVKKVYTLGIDGGKKYATGFNRKDCLANGQKSFDVQFKEIDATLKRHRMEWTNLATTLG